MVAMSVCSLVFLGRNGAQDVPYAREEGLENASMSGRLQSMTGYGKAESVGDGWSVTVEIKSVNNRFLEFQARTSRNLMHLEPRLKQARDEDAMSCA